MDVNSFLDRDPFDLDAWEYLVASCIESYDRDSVVSSRRRVAGIISKAPIEKVSSLDRIYERLLYLASRDHFDSFMRYVEYARRPEERFYQPRAHYLKPIVDAYQDVFDGNLDFLSISQPKRTGKSQTGLFFTIFVSGNQPNRSTLMEGAGDALVRSFYKGCLELIQDDDRYLYHTVFPEAVLKSTNADEKTFNLERNNRFPTVMCRSIDSSQVGLSEATNLLYLDDCVQGREEAHNRDRLDAKWDTIRGDVLGRRIEGTPIVATGTRYSIHDPIGRLQEIAPEMGWRMRIIEIPALDPVTDESNFEHMKDGKPVFTTSYFRNERKMLSSEQWESEFSQQPIEAKGLMFPKDSLRRFFELPAEPPDSIVAACDTAESGSDSCAMPIAYIYGTEIFIADVVFDNSPSEVTKPQCAKKLVDHGVSVATFESNNAGEYFARDVDSLVGSLCAGGTRTAIRTKRTISNKHTRIEFASDNILAHFHFLDDSKIEIGSQYWMFMREVCGYTRAGKVSHDDAPDSLSLLENELRSVSIQPVSVMRRPW